MVGCIQPFECVFRSLSRRQTKPVTTLLLLLLKTSSFHLINLSAKEATMPYHRTRLRETRTNSPSTNPVQRCVCKARLPIESLARTIVQHAMCYNDQCSGPYRILTGSSIANRAPHLFLSIPCSDSRTFASSCGHSISDPVFSWLFRLSPRNSSLISPTTYTATES